MKTTLTAVAALTIAFSPLAAQTNSPGATTLSFVDQQNQTEVLGTDFMGTTVMTKDGQKVGDIANLVFDQNGRIELAVIGVGGFLGVGQKEVAVPFESLKSDMKNNKHVFVVDATKDQLNAAPPYKTLNDQAFNQRIAEWRTKAADSWTQLKDKAAKTYDEAKTRVNEARQPADQPAKQQ